MAFSLLFASVIQAATPEEMAAQYYQYIDTNQWGKLADLMHESTLSHFKSSLLPTLQASANNGRSGLLKKTFGKDATFDDAKKASDKDFFVAFVSNVAGLIRNSGIKNTQTTIIGKVPEGDSEVHVLVRESYKLGKMELINMEVLSFKKAGKKWALLLSGKLRGLVQTIQTTTYQLKNRK